MVMRAEQVSSSEKISGVKLVVLPQDQLAFPEDEGHILKPGQMSYVSFTGVCVG